MLFFFFSLILSICPVFETFADEVESFEIRANACEKILEGESISGARNRAIDKAVFLGLKNSSELQEDKNLLNDHDLNVMIYRLVDDYVQDLTSKVTKSDKDKICVEVSGFINPQNIAVVREEFVPNRQHRHLDDNDASQIIQTLNKDLSLKPQNVENLALVYVEPLLYFNGKKSIKHTEFLKEKIKDNPYYFLTEKKDLADYIITPKLLKAKVDSLDATHKRIQMVVILEISGLSQEITVVSQNRFFLYFAQDNQNEITARLLKKLLQAAGADAVRKIEIAEQKKLEQSTIGHTL